MNIPDDPANYVAKVLNERLKRAGYTEPQALTALGARDVVLLGHTVADYVKLSVPEACAVLGVELPASPDLTPASSTGSNPTLRYIACLESALARIGHENLQGPACYDAIRSAFNGEDAKGFRALSVTPEPVFKIEPESHGNAAARAEFEVFGVIDDMF